MYRIEIPDDAMLCSTTCRGVDLSNPSADEAREEQPEDGHDHHEGDRDTHHPTQHHRDGLEERLKDAEG